MTETRADTKARPADPVQVTLTKPHRHGGEEHKAGAKLAVTPAQAERLKQHGKI
jgi:hypothetical protein